MIPDSEDGVKADFVKELYRRLNLYFSERQLSKKADKRMIGKLIIALIWWGGSLILLFTVKTSALGFFVLYAFQCFAQLFILLNIAHDANHKAIFKKTWLNRLFSYSFDICGISSYMWRCLHHEQHHYCININGEDESLVARGLFRFNADMPKKFMHRFQHIYFLFFYGLFTVDWIFIKDFECFFFPYTDFLKNKKHRIAEYIKLFTGKIVYITYMIFLPVYYLGYPFITVILIFLVSHFLIGIVGSIIIQVTHPLESSEFPKSKNEYENFVFHIFATTCDYSASNPFGKFFYGGLNLHVIHHLMPNVCHTHFPELTAIVKSTAKEYGVPYKENKTIYMALAEQYNLLKRLARHETLINPEPI